MKRPPMPKHSSPRERIKELTRIAMAPDLPEHIRELAAEQAQQIAEWEAQHGRN